jgi:hypothetical protein
LHYSTGKEQQDVAPAEFQILLIFQELRDQHVDHYVHRHYPQRKKEKFKRIRVEVVAIAGPDKTKKGEVANPEQNVSKDPGVKNVVFHCVKLLFVMNKPVVGETGPSME